MAYSKTDWQDLPSTATPLSAANLNKMENELKFLDDNSKFLACTNLGTKNNTFDLDNLNPGETCSWDNASVPTHSPVSSVGCRCYCFYGYGGSYGKVQIAFRYDNNVFYLRTWFGDVWTGWKAIGDSYSSEEVRVGTWTDGRVVYRKVISISSGFSTTMTFAHGISNFKTLVNAYGYQISAGSQKAFPTIYPSDMARFGAGVYDITSSNITVSLGTWVAENITQLTIILEYTKTTD